MMPTTSQKTTVSEQNNQAKPKMPADVVLSVKNVSKKFCRNLKHSMLYGIKDLSHDLLGLKQDTNTLRKDEFWALKNINFEVRRGETIGMIGANGSGKSTLLRMLTGIFPPDHGEIRINGRVGSLISVGAGFHPNMTGRENIYLNAAILGMSRSEIEEKFQKIIDFAEIADFIDAPVSTYSSGMKVRLGFSIAIHADIDMLLADEILAVGDLGFMLKCYNKIGELKKKGVSTIFVSHDLQAITNFANRVLLLNKGEQEYIGENAAGLTLYKKHFPQNFQSEGEIEKVCTGIDDFRILDIRFRPVFVNNRIEVENLQDIQYTIYYETTREFNNLSIDTVLEIPIPGSYYFQSTNHSFNKSLNCPKGRGILEVTIKKLSLNNMGAYLNFALWAENKKIIILWWRKIPVYVLGSSLSGGWSHFQMEYTIQSLG